MIENWKKIRNDNNPTDESLRKELCLNLNNSDINARDLGDEIHLNRQKLFKNDETINKNEIKKQLESKYLTSLQKSNLLEKYLSYDLAEQRNNYFQSKNNNYEILEDVNKSLSNLKNYSFLSKIRKKELYKINSNPFRIIEIPKFSAKICNKKLHFTPIGLIILIEKKIYCYNVEKRTSNILSTLNCLDTINSFDYLANSNEAFYSNNSNNSIKSFNNNYPYYRIEDNDYFTSISGKFGSNSNIFIGSNNGCLFEFDIVKENFISGFKIEQNSINCIDTGYSTIITGCENGNINILDSRENLQFNSHDKFYNFKKPKIDKNFCNAKNISFENFNLRQSFRSSISSFDLKNTNIPSFNSDLYKISTNSKSIYNIKFDSIKRHFICSNIIGNVFCYDILDFSRDVFTPQKVFNISNSAVSGINWLSENKNKIICSSNDNLKIFNIFDNNNPLNLEIPNVTQIEDLNDELMLLNTNNYFKILEKKYYTCIKEIKTNDCEIEVCIDKKNRIISGGSSNEILKFWNF